MVKKFRAYDKFTKQYIATGFHFFGEVMTFDCIGQYLQENPNPAYNGCNILRTSDVIIEQFLGCDKNGDEIYEGDICLKMGEDYSDIHTWKSDDERWKNTPMVELLRGEATMDNFPICWMNLTKTKIDCIKIGNIHEA